MFVTYDVPTSSLVEAGQDDWRAIPGPNGMPAKLAAKKGTHSPASTLPRPRGGGNEMTKDMNFDDLLREWASKVAGQYAGNGDVEVKEPSFPNGAVTVDIELERTLAQMLLWPSGMLEFRVFAIESGEEMAMEHHEIHGNDELAVVLGKVSETVAATEAAP